MGKNDTRVFSEQNEAQSGSKPGVSNSFVGAGHTAIYHSVGGPHCFRDEKHAVNAVINTNNKNII